MEKTEIFECVCGGQLLMFKKFADEKDVFVSYYEGIDFNNRTFFKNLITRIKESFNFFIGKKVVFAEIILKQEDIERLKKYLENL